MENKNTPSNIVPFGKRGWCAHCASSTCSCTTTTLKQQVAALMNTIKEKNEQILGHKSDELEYKAHLAHARIALIKISFECPNAGPIKRFGANGQIEEISLATYINELLAKLGSK